MKERKHYQVPWLALIPGKLYREVIQDKPAGFTEKTFFYLGGSMQSGCIKVLLGENEMWIPAFHYEHKNNSWHDILYLEVTEDDE